MIPKKKKSDYKDPPRYPMVIDYEEDFKQNYSKSVKVMTTEIATKMISFINKDS